MKAYEKLWEDKAPRRRINEGFWQVMTACGNPPEELPTMKTQKDWNAHFMRVCELLAKANCNTTVTNEQIDTVWYGLIRILDNFWPIWFTAFFITKSAVFFVWREAKTIGGDKLDIESPMLLNKRIRKTEGGYCNSGRGKHILWHRPEKRDKRREPKAEEAVPQI